MRLSMVTLPSANYRRLLSSSFVVIAATTACGKAEVRATAPATTLPPAPLDSSASRQAAAASPAGSTVRGTVAAISDTALTITTATGPQQVRIVPPLRVYARTKSDLAHVTPNAFVGITS